MRYLNPNAFQEKVNDDPRNEIETIVGDNKKTPFEPQTKIMRWGNEANISVRLQGLPNDNRNLIQNDFGQIEYGDNNKKFRSYKKQYNNEDAWEMEWILYKHPGTYTEELTLQIKNLEFSKQPPLNEEIAPGEGETVTATHHYDADGNVLAHRPEDVVGSYAVYLSRGKAWNRQSPNMAMWYKLQDEYNSRDAGNEPNPSFAHLDTVSKLSAEISKYEALSTPELPYNKTYMTGKFCHIYRPKLIDANGNEAYADIDINRETAIMTLTYPKTFLDNAVYPVVVDPAFGYTSVGGSTRYLKFNDVLYMESETATLSENGDVESITARINDSSSQNKQFGIYDSSDNLEGVTEISDLGGGINWHTLNFSSALPLTSGTYQLGVATGDDGSTTTDYDQIYYDSEANTGKYKQDSGGSGFVGAYPDPISWTAPTPIGRRCSIYATYTSSGGSSFIPRNASII